MARVRHILAAMAAALLLFLTISFLTPGPTATAAAAGLRASANNAAAAAAAAAVAVGKTEEKVKHSLGFGDATRALPSNILKGDSIAPKLENATAKAELGRATWKFFHTMMARFPEQPTEDEQLALRTFIALFGRLYPCGDCAEHFREILRKYPPQTSSRNAAAGWACFAHNVVNERLGKPEFDCNNLGDFYDCGCGESGQEKWRLERSLPAVIELLHNSTS